MSHIIIQGTECLVCRRQLQRPGKTQVFTRRHPLNHTDQGFLIFFFYFSSYSFSLDTYIFLLSPLYFYSSPFFLFFSYVSSINVAQVFSMYTVTHLSMLFFLSHLCIFFFYFFMPMHHQQKLNIVKKNIIVLSCGALCLIFKKENKKRNHI